MLALLYAIVQLARTLAGVIAEPTTLPAMPPVSLAEQVAWKLRNVPAVKRAAVWRRIVAEHPEGEALLRSWRFWGRPEQFAPGSRGAALSTKLWRWWLVMTGRGWGKTRTAAEWVVDRAEEFANAGLRHRVAAIGPTAGDARDTMVEGESGLLAVCERRGYRADYMPSKRRVFIYVNPKRPTRVTLFSAERPDRLRGPQHHTVWCEEYAAWPLKVDAHGNTAFTNADFGLRLPCPDGLVPQGIVTTTPKPIPSIKAIDADADRAGSGVIRTRGSLYANLRNLAPSFVRAILDRYEGGRLGDQEVHGKLLDVVEGALWTPGKIDEHRVAVVPDTIDLIVVGVDPPGSSTGAECGIVVVGADSQASIAYTLEDCTISGPPEVWGAQVVAAYSRWNANYVVAETNYGGEMVVSTIHAVDGSVPVDKVVAKVGKRLRAEPVSTLAANGRAVHVGYYGDLESQQVSWVPGDTSPDRLDAYVYAVTRCLGALTRPPGKATSPNRASRRGARWTPASGQGRSPASGAGGGRTHAAGT